MEVLRVGDPRLALMQRMRNEFAAFVAERMFATMFPPDATLSRGDSFTLKLKAVDLNVTGERFSENQTSTLLMDKTLTEAAKERLVEEYRQGGGMSCLLQHASNNRLILTLSVFDRNGDTLFFIGPKQIALDIPVVKKPRKKVKK